MIPDSCIYDGVVVHKRLKPRPHALSYRVFWLFLDLDRHLETGGGPRLLSRNRLNAVSLHDRDHGIGDGDLAAHARATFIQAGLEHACARVFLLSFPRVLGYAFNPISVYYGFDADGAPAAAIYEVNNTFGERHSYVVGLDRDTGGEGGIHSHGCTKALYVSPFTEMAGRYSFRLSEPGRELVLGVMLRDGVGPVLKTHLRARAIPLTDANIAARLLALPFMTMKVMAGIHVEAGRLWLKGTPLTHRPAGARYSVSQMRPRPVAMAADAGIEGL